MSGGKFLNRPVYHVSGATGWVNDPNGPLQYNGVYHMFFQHLPTGCAWNWQLAWGHAVSRDLINWTLLPPAVSPTPGSYDADGCFSGCAALNHDGVPTLMYTGVRLKSTDSCVLPPSEFDLKLPFVETQCAAVPADLSDPYLTYWNKIEEPWLLLPPPSRNLAGWRDPFLVNELCLRDDDRPHDKLLLIGSGVKGLGGTIMVYRSSDQDVLKGWSLEEDLCCGYTGTARVGNVWECPILCKLQPSTGGSAQATSRLAESYSSDHLCSVSGNLDAVQLVDASNAMAAPPPHISHPFFFCISPDACTNPSWYWLGNYRNGKYDLKTAYGPYRLDLGDVSYAPNTLVDEQGRTILWTWQQERRRKVASYEYAGCLSQPRLLSIDVSTGTPQLVQSPAPEMVALRRPEASWHLSHHSHEAPPVGTLQHLRQVSLPASEHPALVAPTTPHESSSPLLVLEGVLVDIPNVSCDTLDITVSLLPAPPAPPQPPAEQQPATRRRPSIVINSWTTPKPVGRLCASGSSSGLLLRSWQAGSEGSAAVVFHWDIGVLEVVFEAIDPDTLQFSLNAPRALRVGGRLRRPPAPGEPLELRLFLDHSLLEVFTSKGEVLSTRVYRGACPPDAPGVAFISVGGDTLVTRAHVYEMRTTWVDRQVFRESALTAQAVTKAHVSTAAKSATSDEQLTTTTAAAAPAQNGPALVPAQDGVALAPPLLDVDLSSLPVSHDEAPFILAGAMLQAPDLAELLLPDLLDALAQNMKLWQQLASDMALQEQMQQLQLHNDFGGRGELVEAAV